MEKWMAHNRALAVDIGPRGSTTEAERQAAEYARKVMEQAGASPRVETFTSARSIYHPHLAAAVLMLTAFVIYPLGGQITAWLALLLSLGTLASDLLELGLRANPLRWLLPKGQSQNVIGIAPPAGEHRQDLVVIGHLDSHRTPIIFKNQNWLRAYQTATTVFFTLFAMQVIVYAIGAVTGAAWVWPATIPAAIAAIALALMCLHADATPFSPGANDNANGAALVLTLAEILKETPLQHTRVWLVNTGCEEVNHYGAVDFFRQHRGELVRPVCVVFESMGVAGPGWLLSEGIVVPFHPHPRLEKLMARLAQDRPELGAYPARVTGGNTEMADALQAGVPAITIIGITRDGGLPYWHQTADTIDKIDPAVLERSYAFTLAYLQQLDETAPLF